MDPLQKWLTLNYSFLHIQKSVTRLVQNDKFFRILSLWGNFEYEQKNYLKEAIFAKGLLPSTQTGADRLGKEYKEQTFNIKWCVKFSGE